MQSSETADRSAALEAAIGRTWTDSTPWEFLSDLTAIGGRMGGSDGEREAATVVADAFEAAGVRDVSIRAFEVNEWRRGDSTLQLTGDIERSFDAVALPYAPAGDVTGAFVDGGYGTPPEIDDLDVRNRIVVASTTTPPGGRFIHRMEKFAYAIESGAIGFVFVNHLPGQLPPTGSLTFGTEASVPAVGVSTETGSWLREYAANTPGATAQMRLSVDAETVPGESRNVQGRVGPDTDEELLLLAHYDGHDIAEGALDNGCGIATVLSATRILSTVADDLDRGVRIAAVGSEEIGLLGSEHLAGTIDVDRIAGVLNVDGAGRFRDLVAMAHASEATAAAAESVAAATRHPIDVEVEPHPFSDQWPFVRAGVPSMQLHSDSGDRGRGWGHTHADTRDKVDDRNVREHGILTALLTIELAGRDLPRLDRGDLAAAFREADFEVGMRAAGLWPAEWE
ncbi:MAG: M28 family peptidase [Halobacteriota archaeon]